MLAVVLELHVEVVNRVQLKGCEFGGESACTGSRNVNVAVAGYAAVGAVLGAEARVANVAYDTHLEPDSDVMIAIGAAEDEGHVEEEEEEEEDIWGYIEDADARVALRMTDDTLAAVAEIGLYLAEISGLKMLWGDTLRREIGLASAAESDAQEQLRTWWDDLN